MKKTLFPLIALLFILVSCNKNAVEITSFSPTGEIPELTTFEIAFSKDLAPEDKLDQWLEDEFVTFDPPIIGKFKWLASNYLIFSPDVPLKPGTDYKAKVTKEVLFNSKLSGSFDDYEFHTQYFDAVKADFYSSKIPRSNYAIVAKMNLHFNYEVNPEDLAKYLEIKKGDKKVKDFTVETKDPSKVIAITIAEQKQTDDPQEFKITVKKGLQSPITEKGLTEDRVFTYILPPLTRLAITSVSSGFAGANKGWIEVFTTQEVDDKVVKKFITLDPNQKYKIKTNENHFRIEGSFSPGSMVDIKIKKGLPGLYGGTLEHEYEETLVMADLTPDLKFTDENGKYLMRSGLKNLEIQAINVPKVEVEIHEVFANNLLFFIYQNGGGGYYDDYDDYYYDDYYYYDEGDMRVGNYGRKLYSETIDLGDYKNRVNNFTLNIEEHLDERFKGSYVIKIRDSEDRWRRQSKMVSASDMAIIAKRSKDDMLVFVNSIGAAEPMAGVDVQLISSNNQTLLQGQTDAEGVVRFEDIKSQEEGFSARLITATQGLDFNYVDLRESRIETSRYDVGGRSEPHEEYETFIYSERNLYRPGETAFFSGIVRNKAMGVVNDLPVQFKIINPRGKELKVFTETLNSQGSFEEEFKLPTETETGEYVAELYSGSSNFMGSYRFSVEEFVPDKIRVRVDADKKIVALGDPLKVDIEAEYLFGAPCSGQQYEVDVRLSHSGFYSKKYKGYSWNDHNFRNEYLENEFDSGELDEDGKSVFNFYTPEGIEGGGIIRGTAYASVFDATGRTVTRSVGFKTFPKDYFIGVKTDRYYYGDENDVEFMIAAVDGEDNDKKNFKAEVEVIRYEWKSVLEKSGSGYWRYRSVQKEVVEEKKSTITLNGEGSYKFRPKRSGRHEIRVYKKGSSNYVKNRFYVYSWRSSTASSFEVDKEGKVEMVLDKDQYKPGDQAKVLFSTPFSGKMLVTVERDKVLSSQFINVENNSAEFTFTITEEHLPNVFVSATLFKGHSAESGTPFLVGHGYASLKVDEPSYKLDVEIKAPERIKPRTTQEIVVKTNPEQDIHVTLALVDEGILQIKNYKTPDPYGYMYAKKALKVKSYDMYELLLPEVKENDMHPAGGDENGSAKRINPITAQRFKLLAYWSGIRKTDANGEVKIRVPIPQFNGEARLMAVAYAGPKFGSGSKAMKISDDVVMMPAIPRVMSVGDSIILPVSLLNTTEKSGNVKVELSVKGPLEITSKKSASTKIAGKGSEVVKFGLKAKPAVGVAKIILKTTGLDEVTQETEIAVRPVSPLVVEDGSGVIKAGETKNIQIPSNFIKESQNTRLVISKFPAAKLSKHMKYLVGYPYGCVEQTTSKAFPQIYFEDLAAAISPDKFYKGSPTYFVNEAITKLQGMLRNDGSLSYWPGGSYYSWWGTAYATHFLLEAQKAGYNVSQYNLDRQVRFLNKMAADKQTYNYRTWNGNAYTVAVKAKKEAIYSLYVMALAGKGDLSLMNYYRARTHLLSNDMIYLLAGSFALMDEWNAYHELLPNGFVPEKPERLSGGSFDSEVRSNAIILNTLLDVDPENKQIPLLVKHLNGMTDKFYSTQDRCWGFLALGKAARKSASAKVNIDIQVGGKTLDTYKDGNFSFESDDMNGKKVSLNATGSGEVYYFWSTEGIKNGINTVKDIDQGVQVRRKYLDRSGNVISGGTFKQGDLIVCKITIKGGSKSVDNVAISDLVPSAFEIENPRLGTSTSLSWIKNSLYPDYLDVRDDRLLLFTNVRSDKERSYYYMLRVVTAGTFILPPIGADAMYDPEFRSYYGAGKVRVLPAGKNNL